MSTRSATTKANSPGRKLECIGQVEALDASGCVVNRARLDLITGPWVEVVDCLKEQVQRLAEGGLHSLYVRGSVARGTAVPGVSDLDAILLTRDFAPVPLDGDVTALELHIRNRFPQLLRGVELDCRSRSAAALHHPRTARTLRMQAVCVHGYDIIPTLPPCPMGPASMLELPRLLASVRHVISRLQNGARRAERQALCHWIMKIIVRSTFESVQHLSGGHTRDLWPCAESFQRHGTDPDLAAQVWQAVEWAVNPIDDATAITSLIKPFEYFPQAMRPGGGLLKATGSSCGSPPPIRPAPPGGRADGRGKGKAAFCG